MNIAFYPSSITTTAFKPELPEKRAININYTWRVYTIQRTQEPLQACVTQQTEASETINAQSNTTFSQY